MSTESKLTLTIIAQAAVAAGTASQLH